MMWKRQVGAVTVGILLLISINSVLRAQSVTSSIQGAVTDVSGAMVPGAAVILTNVLTGVVLRTESSGTGNYSFPSVPPGTYSLEVTKPVLSAIILSVPISYRQVTPQVCDRIVDAKTRFSVRPAAPSIAGCPEVH